jgi:hypothetical protein
MGLYIEVILIWGIHFSQQQLKNLTHIFQQFSETETFAKYSTQMDKDVEDPDNLGDMLILTDGEMGHLFEVFLNQQITLIPELKFHYYLGSEGPVITLGHTVKVLCDTKAGFNTVTVSDIDTPNQPLGRALAAIGEQLNIKLPEGKLFVVTEAE